MSARFGLFLSLQHPGDRDARELVRERLEQVRAARELGFASVLAGQHFLVPQHVQMLQPVPILGRIAAEAEGMTVGAGVLIATLLNPVEVAENAATLHAITDGRFVLGAGLGYRPEEDAAFGVPAARVRTFAGKVDVVRRLLDGEEVTAEGPGYRLEGARVTLAVRPRPPIWLAAATDGGVRRAARLGDTWLAGPTATLDDIRRQTELFEAEHGARPAERPAIRDVVVAPTDEEAAELGRTLTDPSSGTTGALTAGLAAPASERYIVGGPGDGGPAAPAAARRRRRPRPLPDPARGDHPPAGAPLARAARPGRDPRGDRGGGLMRFGLYLSLQHPVARDPRDVMQERVELVRLVRDLGFDSVVCGQHFLVPGDVFMLQPVPVLGRIAAEAEGMQIGTSVLITTLLNPVEVVENALTLAAMTEQPFVLGVGLGYRPEEDAAFGVPKARVRAYTEKLEVIGALLAGESVTAEGPGYRLEGARVTMRVDPRPQLHVAATSENGVRRAGRLGDAWVVSTTVPLEDVRRLGAIFDEAHGGHGVERPALRDVVLRGTDEEARELAKPFLEPAPAPAGSTPAFRPDVDAEGAYLIGGPETVIRKLREHEAAGIDHVVFRPQRPGLSLDDAKETLRLLARDVLPRMSDTGNRVS